MKDSLGKLYYFKGNYRQGNIFYFNSLKFYSIVLNEKIIKKIRKYFLKQII